METSEAYETKSERVSPQYYLTEGFSHPPWGSGVAILKPLLMDPGIGKLATWIEDNRSQEWEMTGRKRLG